MKRLRIFLSAVLASLALAATAQASVITFNEVDVLTSNPTINGVSFWAGDPGVLNDTFTADFQSPGNAYLASGYDDHTGNTPGLYNTFVGVTLAPKTTSVFFDVMSEKGIPDPTTVYVEAFAGGVSKGTQSVTLADNGYQHLAWNLGTEIDRLFIYDDLNSFGYSESFDLDNFGFGTDRPGPAPVPEPSTWLLLASGLLGTACWKRKKAQS